MTRLSVVICARNEARHVPEQLLALQTQRVRPDDIVLVDDGSTDQTRAIMESFAGYMSGVRVVHHEESVGATAAYNRGVAESTGDWVYDASANDVIGVGACAALARAISQWPDAAIVTGDLVGLPLGWSARPEPILIDPDRVARLLGQQGIIHGAATAVSRRAWDSVGGWQPDVGGYVDALMWHTLACRHGVVYTPHPIAWVRPNEPGQGNGAISLDREHRRPYLEAFARHIMRLEEPTRSRLVGSALWSIREFAPEMTEILSQQRHTHNSAGVVS